MKKIVLLAFAGLVMALSLDAQIRTHIFAGPQINGASYKILDEKQSTQFKPGFMIGGGIKVPFDNQLYFAPVAFYSLKGFKVDLTTPSFPPDTSAVSNDLTVHSVELGFLLQFDFSPASSHLFLRTGPSLDFALIGKEKFVKPNGTTVNRNMKFGFGDYGHYLASGIVQFGYETEKFYLMGQYHGTLGSISNADDGPKIKHRSFGISAGVYLK